MALAEEVEAVLLEGRAEEGRVGEALVQPGVVRGRHLEGRRRVGLLQEVLVQGHLEGLVWKTISIFII